MVWFVYFTNRSNIAIFVFIARFQYSTYDEIDEDNKKIIYVPVEELLT